MSIRFFSGIRAKFILTATLIMALSSITWGSWAWYNERQHLFEKLEGEGRLLLNSLKAPIINSIIYEEIGVVEDARLLDNFVEELVDNRELPIVYAFITDREGKVLAHNHYEEFGKTYDDPLTLSSLAGKDFQTRIRENDPDGGSVLDMAMPLRIAGQCWGSLRVGLSMAPLERELSALKFQIFAFSVIFFLLATIAFYLVGSSMSRPLEQLSRAMADVNHESLEAALPPKKRDDEIGQLQESFFEMLRRMKKSEQERQLAVSRMIRSEKLATIGKLVAGVAHEVNNPLAAISACVYNLEGKMEPGLLRYTKTLKVAMQRIEVIVRQLTDFNRATTLDLQPTQSNLFFREAASFAVMALKKRPDVRLIGMDSSPPTILQLDKNKIHQVLLNLILNAADVSPPDSIIEFLAYCHEEFYYLAVKDQGGGVPAEEREKIFEIFHTTKPAGEGSGIGLAICKSIVEMHRGEIILESSPGETLFIIKIPLGACRT